MDLIIEDQKGMFCYKKVINSNILKVGIDIERHVKKYFKLPFIIIINGISFYDYPQLQSPSLQWLLFVWFFLNSKNEITKAFAWEEWYNFGNYHH